MKHLNCSHAELLALPEGYIDVAIARAKKDAEAARIKQAAQRLARRSRR